VTAAARRDRAERAAAVIDRFAVLWPRAFFLYERDRKPLALGIDKELIELCAPAIDKALITVADIKRALTFYCSASGYFYASRKPGVARINLQGEAVGIVSESEAANASLILNRRRRRKEAAAATAAGSTESPQKKLADSLLPSTAGQLKHGDVVRCVPQKAQRRVSV
jgi:sRNA-binding protein